MIKWHDSQPRRPNLILCVISLSLWLSSEMVLGAGDPRGSVYVAPGALDSGYPNHAVKLLRRRFKLRDIHNPTPITDFPSNTRGVVLTGKDLANPAIAKFVQNAYAAGLTVALVDANDEEAERLRVLVGRDLPIFLSDDTTNSLTVAMVAIREDVAGNCCSNRRLHRTHILGELTSQRAERRAAQWLKAVFNKWPEAVRPIAESPSDDLVDLANSTLTDKIVSDQRGRVLQIVNTTWAARSFQSQVDYYYVQQWLTFRTPKFTYLLQGEKTTNSWVSPSGTPITVEFGPGTTENATTYSSGVNFNIGGVAGYNKGAIATVNGGVTISNSTSTTVPQTNIKYTGNPQYGTNEWEYLSQKSKKETTYAYTQNWIWAIPLNVYSSNDPVTFSTRAVGATECVCKIDPEIVLSLSSSVPQPFNHTQLGPPTVEGVDRSQAKPGSAITITGSNFYQINGVLLGGAPVNTANYEVVESDTKIKLIIPGSQPIGPSQSVVVNTQEGISNTNVTIDIIN